MAETLVVENLHVNFGTPGGSVNALNGVSFSQQEGEIYCMVGESGAGKSTLALAIMGLLPINATVPRGQCRVRWRGPVEGPSRPHAEHTRQGHLDGVFQDAQAALNPVQLVGPQLEEVILAHMKYSSASGQPDGPGYAA